MKWSSAISTDPNLEKAVDEVARDLRRQLGENEPDLLLVFLSHHHRSSWSRLPALLGREFPGAARIGCSGGGTIGAGRELESQPSVAISAAHLPGVTVRPFHIDGKEVPGLEAAPAFWQGLLNLEDADFLLLAEPFTCDAQELVDGLDLAFPDRTTVGGLASGAFQRGQNILLLGDEIVSQGAVGVALSGNLQVDAVVAQGCRPIANPMFITACDGPLVFEIDGRRPAEVLGELYDSLPERDKILARTSLFLGVAMREDKVAYDRGDFLVRNIAGLDAQEGALVVGANLRSHQVIQFHLRDAVTSAEDLDEHLATYRSAGRPSPTGALLFSCLGRGMGLYERPDHDSQAFLKHMGPVPLTGFFCNGEIGPVHGRTFVHGYTSAFALFRPLDM